jgi:SAM-dependent methyltransferase
VIERGAFDTDKRALEERIRAHDQFGKRDLNEWIFEHLQVGSGHVVLDLGSGTGKQSVPIAQLVGPRGRVVAVDASAESLDALHVQADGLGVADRIATLQSTFEDLDRKRVGGPFDRVLSSYSLYYAREPEALIVLVRSRLIASGRFFFCGPGRDNNKELRDFHYSLRGETAPPTAAAEFMEVNGPELARKHFGNAQRVEFENPLSFDSAEALVGYWTSYNLYDASLDELFRAAAERHFRARSHFVTVKRVIGIVSSG